MEDLTEESRYQVFCCNIYWNSKSSDYRGRKIRYNELPTQMSIDIPESVLNQANKNKESFNEIIEQFCYNLLTRKNGYEVNSCQIWLPLED